MEIGPLWNNASCVDEDGPRYSTAISSAEAKPLCSFHPSFSSAPPI
jgi:hypothetical protein